MAKLCVVGDIACALFILWSILATTWCLNDYNYYNIENSVGRSGEEIYFQHHEHQLHKRDLPNQMPQPPAPTNATKVANVSSEIVPIKKTVAEISPEYTPVSNTTKGISMTEPTEQAKDVLIPNKDVPKDTKDVKPPKKVLPNPKITVENNDDISINKFADPNFNLNMTLDENNIKVTRTDHHIYYNSTFRTDNQTAEHYWVDVDNQTEMKVSDLLSKSHRRAATVRLSFDFPFYGHYIRNVTIATGGFLYTGDYVHSWLAATQYIAPLMANFDTGLSNDSYIKYVMNSTSFTVLWENVSLQDNPEDGKFTFQTTLHSNGDIVFVYQNVPLIIEQIQDNNHPVKVGLSDAYIIDRTIFFVRRKTIYEYHRVNFRKEDIKNGTVIYFSALPTCPMLKNCTACLTKQMANFQCAWCPSLNKCSNGLDRSRQEWLTKMCDKRQIKNDSECGQPYSEIPSEDHEIAYNHDHTFDTGFDDPTKAGRLAHDSSVVPAPQPVRMGVSSVIAILFILSLISGMFLWVFYAYRNPHTTSGQILIRYRPSQWSWRRGEARYTAATIHM